MRPALLVIDMQHGVFEAAAPIYRSDPLLATVAGLLARARATGVPVVFVEDEDVGPADTRAGTTHARIAPLPGEPVIRKRASDSFHDTALEATLRAAAIDRLVIVGCMTEQCIDSACRRATTLGFAVTLVADGHSTSDTRVLAAPQIIAHHNQLLDGFGCEVRGVVAEITVVSSEDVAL